MKIVIVGAGGVGGYFGGRLAAAGSDVAFIARGEHLAALRREGLRMLRHLEHPDHHYPRHQWFQDCQQPAKSGPAGTI